VNVSGVDAVGDGELPACWPLTAASTQCTHGWVGPLVAGPLVADPVVAATVKVPAALPLLSVMRNGISGSPVPHPNGLTSPCSGALRQPDLLLRAKASHRDLDGLPITRAGR
jgi:hypothetical protein